MNQTEDRGLGLSSLEKGPLREAHNEQPSIRPFEVLDKIMKEIRPSKPMSALSQCLAAMATGPADQSRLALYNANMASSGFLDFKSKNLQSSRSLGQGIVASKLRKLVTGNDSQVLNLKTEQRQQKELKPSVKKAIMKIIKGKKKRDRSKSSRRYGTTASTESVGCRVMSKERSTSHNEKNNKSRKKHTSSAKVSTNHVHGKRQHSAVLMPTMSNLRLKLSEDAGVGRSERLDLRTYSEARQRLLSKFVAQMDKLKQSESFRPRRLNHSTTCSRPIPLPLSKSPRYQVPSICALMLRRSESVHSPARAPSRPKKKASKNRKKKQVSTSSRFNG